MNCDRILYRVPVDQLINLLQEIPFTDMAGYIVFRETHIHRFNAVVLKNKAL